MTDQQTSEEGRTHNKGIYASVAGRYILGGRISRRQYLFNQQE